MLFFAYGTLMDDDVRADLLGARARRLTVTPGVLLHYRRRRARGGRYPVIVPETGGRVRGLFLSGIDRDLALWMAHFEGPGYAPEPVTVLDAEGAVWRPWSFLPTEIAPASGDPWHLRAWQHREKPKVRRTLDAWRREVARGHPMSLDAPWLVRRRLAEMPRGEDAAPGRVWSSAAGRRLVPPVANRSRRLA